MDGRDVMMPDPSDRPMLKPRLAFVGHSFHKKTLSHVFLCEILEREFDVDIFWDDEWQGGSRVDLAAIEKQYDTFVFFQIMYGRKYMKRLRRKNVICVPMYDAVWDASDRFWRRYGGFRILCFSKTIYDRINRLGMDAMYLQYYPPVEEESFTSTHIKPVAYFWQRVDEISWHQVRRLLTPDQVRKVIINTTVDPGHSFVQPADEDIRDYNIEFVSWFEKKADYFEMLRGTDVMIAPRLREGIGFSFLHAMARGKVIAAANHATANEYISNDTGYLFDAQNPAPLDFSDVGRKAESNHKQYIEGHQLWLQNEHRINEYIGGSKFS
jgi:glycosyltransferase involved in cell wall biosynthesis